MATTVNLTCPCGETFEKLTAEVKRQRKKNPNRVFYCSSTCYGKQTAKKHLGDHLCSTKHLRRGRHADLFSPFRYYMKKARDRRHETDLDLPYLKALWEQQGGRCALSGVQMEIPPTTGAFDARRRDPLKPSLDRIDSSKGYLKGNVRFVTMIANFAKQGFSDDVLIEFCRAFVAHTKLNEGACPLK